MPQPLPDTDATRQSMIDACLWMGRSGINQGTSGNISLRVDDGLLITPSAVAYEKMTPDNIVRIPLSGEPVSGSGMRPSTEWRFHQAIMQKRPDANAVVHAHPTYCTAVAIQRRAIPAIHYMIAIFGGADVPVTDYALFGSPALAAMVADALSDRHGCLMANHGATTLGDTLDRALWRMQELETLAKMYTIVSAPGAPVILSDAEIEETLASIQNYGQR